MPIGAIIGTGISALGSYLGTRKQSQTSQSNVDKTISANRALAEDEFQRNKQMQQMEFLQNQRMAAQEFRRNKHMSDLEFNRNLKMSDHEFDQNRQMAETAHQRDIELWERQMDYNTPEAQMERFKDAGLNPHLIYGQGTPGNVSSHPTYQPAQYNAPQYDAPRYNRAEYDAASYQAPTEDYTYKADTSLAEGMKELGKFHDFAKKDEQVKQEAVKTWLAEETKLLKYTKERAVTEKAVFEGHKSVVDFKSAEIDKAYKKIRNRIEKVKAEFWEKGISPQDATWIRAGLSAMQMLGMSKERLEELWKKIPYQMMQDMINP